MNEILLLKGNPSKRRGSRKRRTAAQRAATKKLVALNRSRFHKNPSEKRRRKTLAKAVKSASRSTRRYVRRNVRRSWRREGSGIASMLKTGAIMGGGALTADIGMGLVGKFMPSMTSLTSRVNPDGSINYSYYLTKGALIYAMGKYGTRVTRHAPVMAAGAITVMAYELFKSFVPSDGSIPLGYFNPGRIVSGGNLGKMGRIMRTPGLVPQSQALPNSQSQRGVNGLGKILALPSGAGKGAIASTTIRNLNGSRR